MDYQGDGYFTNLMSEGDPPENFQQSREDDPPVNSHQQKNSGDYHSSAHQSSKKAKSSKTRAANFNQEEDVMLVTSWLNISLDGIVGGQQKLKAYWKRIYDFYNDNKTFPSDRTQGSLEHRWCVIQAEVSKFCGYLAQVNARNQSGLNEQDRIFQATKLYEEGEGRAFRLLHCWNVMKNHPKWLDYRDQQKKGQKKSKNGSPTTTDVHVVDLEENTVNGADIARPLGRKSQNELLKKGKGRVDENSSVTKFVEVIEKFKEDRKEIEMFKEKKMDERNEMARALEKERAEKQLAIEEKKAAIEAEKVDIKKKEYEMKIMMEEERIMNTDVSDMDDLQKEYYQHLKKEIIARKRAKYG